MSVPRLAPIVMLVSFASGVVDNAALALLPPYGIRFGPAEGPGARLLPGKHDRTAPAAGGAMHWMGPNGFIVVMLAVSALLVAGAVVWRLIRDVT